MPPNNPGSPSPCLTCTIGVGPRVRGRLLELGRSSGASVCRIRHRRYLQMQNNIGYNLHLHLSYVHRAWHNWIFSFAWLLKFSIVQANVMYDLDETGKFHLPKWQVEYSTCPFFQIMLIFSSNDFKYFDCSPYLQQNKAFNSPASNSTHHINEFSQKSLQLY